MIVRVIRDTSEYQTDVYEAIVDIDDKNPSHSYGSTILEKFQTLEKVQEYIQ